MSQNSKGVQVQVDSRGLAVLQLGDPSNKVTVLNMNVMDSLSEAVAKLEANPAVKGLVIAGCRNDMFAAGADIEAIKNVTDPAEGEKLARKGQLIFDRISKLPFPTVAAIGGPCLGGGLELALACNFRIASDHEKTKIGLPEVKLGIIPGFGGTQRLPRVIGLPASLTAILTGRLYEPEAARKLGIVDDVVPAADLAEYCAKLALKQIQKQPKQVHRLLVEGNPLSRAFIASQAKKGVMKETKGHYPAALKAIDSVVYGLGAGIDQGLENEAKILGEMIVSPVSKSLVNLFFLTEKTKRFAAAAENSAPISQAGVVGCGVMGAGIAISMADKGIAVRVRDISPEAVAKALEQANGFWGSKVKKRRMKPVEKRIRMDLLTPTIPPARFQGAELVIEAVAEKMEVKTSVFQAIAKEVSPNTILATNTSSLSVTAMQKNIPNPERVVGIHFFNPVDKMPLVEIVRGESSSELTIARSAALALRLGKFPIVVKDVPGFLVNRILAPYLNEAAQLLMEGVSMRAIDRAAEKFGMPMGPITLLDEVGLDIASSAAKTLSAAYGERMKAPPLLDKLLEAGRKGKKSGAGFYRHEKGKRLDDPEAVKLLNLKENFQLSDEEIIDRLVLPIINEAVRCLEENVVESADDVDLGSVMGFGFAPFRGGVLRYADTLGSAVILDKLKKLQSKLGNRFQPCSRIEQLAASKKNFH